MTPARRALPAVLALALATSWCLRADAATPAAPGNCPTGIDFEAAGYTVRDARVEGIFMYLPWVRAQFAAARQVVATLNGQPYRNEAVRKAAKELENTSFLPDAGDRRVRFSIVVTRVERCSDRTLDLVYSVFPSQIAPAATATFEARESEQIAPEKSAGADQVTGRLRLSPLAGYDESSRLFGGASLEYRPGEIPFVDAITAQGLASDEMHVAFANVAGSRDPEGRALAHVEWQLNALDSREPTDESDLKRRRLSAQFSALSHPIGRWQVPLRFGGALEAGRLGELAASGATSPYSEAKLYGGATARLDRHAFAASYGMEIGSRGSFSGADWIRQIVDLADDFDVPVRSHVSLEIESRLTGGWLSARGELPGAAQFFGGSREQPFVPGETWTIRSNPVIRGIPPNQFHLPVTAGGSSHFVAANFTAAMPLWHTPVVPPELSDDAEFKEQLDSQIVTATSFVATEFVAGDPHFKLVAARIDDVRATLAALQTAVNAASATHSGEPADLFRACTAAIRRTTRRADAASRTTGGEQLGNTAALLSSDEDLLTETNSACIDELNAQLNDAAMATQGATLRQIHEAMEADFAKIDQATAQRRAESEMSFVKRTLNALINDVNVLSVSPMIGFDFARIAPAPSRLGSRYAIGGGVRVTLVNSAAFTLGYFANPRHLSGEPRGALVISLQLKDVLE